MGSKHPAPGRPNRVLAVSFALLWAILVPSSVAAQTTSQIPKDLGGATYDTYLGVAENVGAGTLDPIQVVFYEVESTVTAPFYIAVDSPGSGDAIDANNAGAPESYFDVLGGPGALSNPVARQLVYASRAEATSNANLLASRTFTTESGWNYIGPFLPSQGELLGNKYYFRIVMSINADVNRNAFRYDISFSTSPSGGVPPGSDQFRAFAYGWSIAFLGDSNGDAAGGVPRVYEFFPLVPEGTSGQVYNNFVASNVDIDDGQGAGDSQIDINAVKQAFDQPGGSLDGVDEPVTTAGPSGQTNNTTFGPIVANEDGGTWRITYTDSNGKAGFVSNPADLWHWLTSMVPGATDDHTIQNRDVLLRTYSEFYDPADAHSVALQVDDGVAITTGTEEITLQVVDASGNPVPFIEKVWVGVSGDGRIASINGDTTGLPAPGAYVTTDSGGLAVIEVSDSTPGTEDLGVTVTVTANGGAAPGPDGDESVLPGSPTSTTVDFLLAPDPEISSTANSAGPENTTFGIADVRVWDPAGGTLNTTDDIRIILPSSLISLGATFNPGATVSTGIDDTEGGATTGTVGAVSYEAGNTIALIPVTFDFGADDRVTIGGLEIVAPANVSGSGSLRLSFDGDQIGDVADDKIVTISDGTTTFTWAGGIDTDWTNGSNWVGGAAPTDGANVVIPAGATPYPVVDAALTAANSRSINSLTIDGSASMSLAGFDLEVTGSVSNDGLIVATGGEAVTVGVFDDSRGTVRYTGSLGVTPLPFGNSYFNLELGTGAVGNHVLQASLSVNGDLTLAANYTLTDAAANDLTVAGDFLVNGNFFPFGGASTVSGTTTNSGTIQNDTGLLTFAGPYGGTGTLDFAGSGDIVFQSDADFTGGSVAGVDSADIFFFSGGGTQQLTSAGNTLPNLGVVNSSTVIGIDDMTLVAGSLLWIPNGTFDLNGRTAILQGSVQLGAAGVLIDSGGQIDLDGNWNNAAGGIYTATGTVRFLDDVTATSVISGDTTFFNFVVPNPTVQPKVMQFGDGSTQTIAAGGSFDVQGTATEGVTLRSDTPGVLWNLDVSAAGSVVVDYVTVADSDLIDAANPGVVLDISPVTPGSSTTDENSDIYTAANDPGTFGNDNVRWYFPVNYVWDDGGGDSFWGTAANWNPDGVPQINDTATIPDTGAFYFVQLAAPAEIDTLTIEVDQGLDLGGQDFRAVTAVNNDGTILSDGTETVTIAGSSPPAAGAIDASGMVAYYSSTVGALPLGNSYYDLVVGGGGGLDIVAPTASLNVNNDLFISVDGRLNTSGGPYDVTVGGDWLNQGEFVSGGGAQTVTFDGVAAQQVTTGGAGNAFNNLTSTAPDLQQQDGLYVNGALEVTGVLSQGGNLLQVVGTTAVDSGANAITLTAAGNDFQGAVTLSNTAGNIQIADANAILLDSVSAGGAGSALTVTTGGAVGHDITDVAGSSIAVPGLATFNAGAGGNVVLGDNGGDTVNFGSLSITAATATISEDSATVVAGGSVATLNLTSAGAITDSGPIIVTGTGTFTAGANDIVLDDLGHDFGTVSVVSAGNATFVDQNGIDLGGIAVTGTVDVTAGGQITDSGGINATDLITSSDGGADLDFGHSVDSFAATNTTGGVVRLTNTAGPLTIPAAGISQAAAGSVDINNTGSVVVTGSVDDGGGGAVNQIDLDTGGAGTITGAGTLAGATIDLQTTAGSSGTVGAAGVGNEVNTAGTTTLTLGTVNTLAGAYVSHAGNLTLASASLAADQPLRVISSGDLVLPAGAINTGAAALYLEAGADLSTSATLSSSLSVTLYANGGTLSIDGPVIGGVVMPYATAGIVQTAALTGTDLVARTYNDAGADIILNLGTNDFDTIDIRTLNAAATVRTAGAISYNDVDGYDIVSVRTTANTRLDGGAGVTSGGGHVRTGGLELRGAGPYTLNNPANILVTLAADTTGNVEVWEQNGVSDGFSIGIVGATTGIDVGGNSVTLRVDGAVTQTQPISAGGLALLGTGPYTLTGANTVPTIAANTTGNVSYSDNGAVAVGSVNGVIGVITGGNDFTLTSGGDITQGQAISTATASFAAGANAITLTNGGNDFTGAVDISNSGANNVQIVDSNAIILGSVSVGTGIFDVTAVGITQNGADTVVQAAGAGAAVFDGGAAAIDLSNDNNFTGNVSLQNTAGNVVINDVNAIRFDTVSTPGDLSVTTGGGAGHDITDIAGSTFAITGLATFDAGAGGDILLGDDAGDTVNFGSVSLTADNATVTEDSTTLIAGAVVGNSLVVVSAVDIGDTGALSVGGTAEFTAGDGRLIILDEVTNSFNGQVSFFSPGPGDLAAVTVYDVTAFPIQAGLVVTANLTVTSEGDITDVGAIDVGVDAVFTTAGAGPAAINLNGASSYGGLVTLDTGATGGNAALTNVVSSIALSGGTDVGGNLTVDVSAVGGSSITDFAAISVTGNATFVGSDGGSITLDNASTFGGNVLFTAGVGDSYAATFNNAAIPGEFELRETVTSLDANPATLNDVRITGDVTLGDTLIAGGNIAITGDLNANSNNITLAGNWTNNGTAPNLSNLATVFFNGGAQQLRPAAGDSYVNLTKSTDGTLTVVTNPLNVTGILSIGTDNAIVDVQGLNFTIGTVAFAGSGSDDPNATFRLTGQQGTQSITTVTSGGVIVNDANMVDAPASADGFIEYYGAAGGTIRLTVFPNLRISGSGTFTIPGATTVNVYRDIRLDAGTLAGNAGTVIRIQRNFDDQLGGSFAHGSSRVQYFGSTDATVYGSHTFYDFFVDVAAEPSVVSGTNVGKIVFFEAGETTSIVAGGTFEIVGTNADPPDAAERAMTDWVPGPPYDTSFIRLVSTDLVDPETRWIFTLPGTASLGTTEFVDIWFSEAVPDITTPANVYTHDSLGWLAVILIQESFTRDTNGNGRIDIIEVLVPINLNDNFSGFEIAVSGYTVSQITTGTDANDRVFWIELVESDDFDTDVTPEWEILDPGLLRDSATGQFLVDHDPAAVPPRPPEVPFDDAAPIVAYSLTVAEGSQNQIFVRFSEPVRGSGGGGEIVPGVDVVYTGAATILSRTLVEGSPGAEEAILLNLDMPVTVGEITSQDPATGTNVLEFSNITDLAAFFDVGPIWPAPPPPEPTHPNTLESRHNVGGAPVEHLVSDIGVGAPGQEPYVPVWAKDQTVPDPVRGGLGTIHRFDGSGFLQPEDITIQSYTNPLTTILTPDIVFDTGVAGRYVRNGLWFPLPLPELVPEPNPGTATLLGNPTVGQLTEFFLPEADPKNRGNVTLDFFFFDGSLYYGRLAGLSTPWYRNFRPWSFDLKSLITQRGGVTIANNVINPERGERATLNYTLDSGSMVRIIVFNLAGDVIDILHSGRQDAGEYSTTWDGTNRQGRPVARGIYFVRFMAGDIDEYRKVMVVKD